MRWVRSHRNSITWLACFALACQLVLSFGHVHLGQRSNSSIISSVLAGDGTTGVTPGRPSHKNTLGLADDYCAVCRNNSLASTLIIPIAPAIEVPYAVDQPLPWSTDQTEPFGFEHFHFQARGPPEA
jgi:hypothetical protein